MSEQAQANGADVFEYPKILHRYVEEVGPGIDNMPRRVRRRFHGAEVVLWQGFVHIDDVEGYVDNVRLRFHLNKWRANRGNPKLAPTTEDIYQIMVAADEVEREERKKPFHVERMARNISRNGVQEPIIVAAGATGAAELWDGNRRFFGTRHIMKSPEHLDVRDRAKWIPALLITPTGEVGYDANLKHRVLTEMNFVEKDHIPWPAYVKAEEISRDYIRMTAADPTDRTLSKQVKTALAEKYGLSGWRVADRWIRMYEIANQFKDYEEEEHGRPAEDVDLVIQERFEYFDELSKSAVWSVLRSSPDDRDMVFNWLFDGKFQAFPDVRMVPKILGDPIARVQANEGDVDAVRRAISTVIANDPTRVKDKTAANQKITQFADWLSTFKLDDYRQLNGETLVRLKGLLVDVTAMLGGLLSQAIHGSNGAEAVITAESPPDEQA